MTELCNPRGHPVWQLNKPIEEMSGQEKLDALGYIESLVLGGVRDLRYIFRADQIRKTLPTTKKNRVLVEQLKLFDIPLRRRA